jgi:hypothetical protein
LEHGHDWLELWQPPWSQGDMEDKSLEARDDGIAIIPGLFFLTKEKKVNSICVNHNSQACVINY